MLHWNLAQYYQTKNFWKSPFLWKCWFLLSRLSQAKSFTRSLFGSFLKYRKRFFWIKSLRKLHKIHRSKKYENSFYLRIWKQRNCICCCCFRWSWSSWVSLYVFRHWYWSYGWKKSESRFYLYLYTFLRWINRTDFA